MRIDLEMAEKFLVKLDDTAEFYTFQLFIDQKKNKKADSGIIIHGTFDEVKDRLISFNEMGYGIFVTVNATDGEGRKKSNIVGLRASFFDKDDGEIDRAHPIDPTMVVRTANGFHVYFCYNSIVDPQEFSDYSKYQKAIAKHYGSDQAVTDVSRVLRVPGFYHLKDADNPFMIELVDVNEEFYSIKEIQEAFKRESGRPKKSAAEKLNNAYEKVMGGRKGDLKEDVLDFFDVAWGLPNDNAMIVHCAANAKKNLYTLEECIGLFEKKGEQLDYNTKNQIRAVYASDSYVVEPYFKESKKDIPTFLMASKLYEDVNKSLKDNKIYAVNERECLIREFTKNAVAGVLTPKLMQAKTKLLYFEYHPYNQKYLGYDEDGMPYFNTYVPPFWKKRLYFNDEDIPCVKKMPEVYRYFLDHLFKDEESIKYVLDWIAYGLRIGRNIPILALVGSTRGIGKNVLANVIQALHGRDNYSICNQQVITKEFNRQVLNKTFLLFDEVSVTNEREFETIKQYTNSVLTVEGKGVDANTCRFYGNILLCNNIAESLSGVAEAHDRQFSIPNLTDTPLSVKELAQRLPDKSKGVDQLWTDVDLISQLACFLFHRDLSSYDNVANFKSAHYHKVIKASKTEWSRYVLEDLYPQYYGCIIPFSVIRRQIQFVERVNIGRTKMDLLIDSNKDKMATKMIGNSKCVIFSKKGESLIKFNKRVSEVRKDSLGEFSFVKEIRDDIF